MSQIAFPGADVHPGVPVDNASKWRIYPRTIVQSQE